MLALLVVVALSAEPVRLGIPGLTYVDIAQKKGDLFADRLSKELERQGLRVTGRQEMETLLGIERQKQLLGCTDDAQACLSELAGALGADAVLTGTLGRAGSGFVVSLKVIDGNGKSLAVASGRVDDEDALIDFLDAAAVNVSKQVFKSLGRVAPNATPEVEVVATERKSARSNWPVPIAVGVAAVAGGAVLWSLAYVSQQRLLSGEPRHLDANGLAGIVSNGKTLEIAAWCVAAAGAALIATGILIKVWPRSQVAFVPTPNGAAAVWTGTFP